MILGHAKYKETEHRQEHELWFSKQNIRYQDEQIYRIKLRIVLLVSTCHPMQPCSWMNGAFIMSRSNKTKATRSIGMQKNLDAWKDISETDTLQIDRDTLFRYIHAKGHIVIRR